MKEDHNQFNTPSKIINDYEYINNDYLTELIIVDGVTSIGERAFFGCKNLKKVIIPDSVTYIGAGAFSNCENLEEVVLSKNTKKINYRTFADCKRLKRIIIPKGVEELEWAVFSGCENLEEIILPKSIKKINKQLFLNCKRLKIVILPIDLEALPDECFRGCYSLDIILNKNVKKLGERVFEKCYKLSTFPQDVVIFGNNCFKDCRSLTTAIINSETKILPDGMFDGCINLNEILYQNDEKLKIGKRCFRNCKSITEVPNFVANFNERSFENCVNITYIDVIGDTIPMACFRGCINLKQINNQENILNMGSFAFSGCENLEEIEILYVNIISAEAFSHCKRLKKVKLNLEVHQINSRAFYNCYSLSEINFPETLEIVKKEAFKNCCNIKKITIPSDLKSFGDAAFSYMDSLEVIEVSPYNKTFITPDNKILINQMQQKLVLYASGCKDRTYTLKDYVVEIDMLNHEIVKPLTCIGEYAFAGAKNIEELTICACTQDIDATSFYGCNNLKKLNIEAISLFTCPGFHIRNHGKHYSEGTTKKKAFIPFEIVTFIGNLVQIFPGALENFTNVKFLNLPNDHTYAISERAFSDCILLEKVNIPKQVNAISKGAFPVNTKLIFENGLQPKGLVEIIHNDQYIGDYKLYVLEDGTYYIEQGDKITAITKKQIDEICSHSEAIHDNPILFLDFMNDLFNHDLDVKTLFNGILMSRLSLQNREILFNNINKNDKFFFDGLEYSKLLDKDDATTKTLLETSDFFNVISYINLLKKYDIRNPLLFNKIFMENYPVAIFEHLINYDLQLLTRTIEDGHLLEINNQSDNNVISNILKKNCLEYFIKYIKNYNIKDKYLFQKTFIGIANNPTCYKLFKIYDANTKRLLISSMTINNDEASIKNLNDLLVLMEITGALEDDQITRQRASTFITEKLFDPKMPNGDDNYFRIVGDDIHRIFNFSYEIINYNKEFANFFMKNYKQLILEEKKHSGFIQRIYSNFEIISNSCTSHKGAQRKLKVTIEKCKNFLSEIKFDGVTDETKDFAKIIGIWYDSNTSWIKAKRIYNESLNSPRNIFTTIIKSEDGTIIFDNNDQNDLKEEINPKFSYEWLPKQNYDNLILGKYCNCCAHIEGAGRGIMRASMILDCCQNLVIRDNLGKIIAKSTIFVNRKEGYAVFNNVESSLDYRSTEDKEKIYNAFLRGSIAFFQAYNKNNIDSPLSNITIGTNRNTILEYLTDEKHPIVDAQQALQYEKYSLDGHGYSGDWKTCQRLVLKR